MAKRPEQRQELQQQLSEQTQAIERAVNLKEYGLNKEQAAMYLKLEFPNTPDILRIIAQVFGD